MSNLHCETITFPSSDGSHTSSAVLYTCPDTPIRAVIQPVSYTHLQGH